MNIDTGYILLWRDLTEEQRESGRWVKLGEGELARAQQIEVAERRNMLDAIFGTAPAPDVKPNTRRGFDATGRPY